MLRDIRGDEGIITSDHFQTDTKLLQFPDRLCHIGLGRIMENDEPDEDHVRFIGFSDFRGTGIPVAVL